MKTLKTTAMLIGTMGLLFLAACAGNNTSTNNTPAPNSNIPTNSPTQTTAKNSPSPTSNNAEKTEGNHGSKGGQVIETGVYHLEMIAEPEAEGTHIDFYLQKGDNHEPVSDAKVTAQIQLPDGTQKTLDFVYDAEGKHYAVLLPEKAAGEYKLAILSDINGEKVNGRFSFKK